MQVGTLYAQRIEDVPVALESVDVVENLGGIVPLDLSFTNSAGENVALSSYFNQDKPVLLVMAYYNCPMLCTLVLNGVRDAVDQLPLVPGKDFTMLTISIDPREDAELAANKQEAYLDSFEKQVVEDGAWDFLVGEEVASKPLANALGFHYYYDEQTGDYAHAAVAFFLTPDGRISRYLYGVQPTTQDIKLALLEASRGKIGGAFDKILLYCYRYDPDSRGYVLFAQNAMRLGGVIMVMVLGGGLTFFWRRESRAPAPPNQKDNSKNGTTGI